MDLLSELFRNVTVRSTLFGRFEARGPWAVRYPTGDLAGFHVVLRGACWLHADGGSATPLAAGDFVVLPHGTPRVMSDSAAGGARSGPLVADVLQTATGLHGTMRDTLPVLQRSEATLPATRTARIGGAGALTDYLCGAFSFAGDAAKPLLAALPDVIHVPGDKGRMMPWVESHLQAITCELTSGRPGAEMVLGRLCEVLFVQAVRAHLGDLPAGAVGWTAAAHDAHVSRALALLHRQPDHDWTIASLGAAVGLSRSSFAARFQTVMGQPPLTYLTTWRMHRARLLLRDPSLSIAQIADRVGYASAAAFASAFKRDTGAAPGAWRRGAATAA